MAIADNYIPPVGETIPAELPLHLRPAIRVLAVDDERAACKLLAIMLHPPAFSCSTAASGEEALVSLQSQHFDAVISDLQMPGIGGLELLSVVRRTYPHAAFLVTTGVDDVEVGVQAMRSGADDYLVKPLLENAVIASLESALYKRHLEQQVENYRLHLEEMVADRTTQLRQAMQQLERSYEDTLQALGAAIDLRDNETAGHSQRVCLYALEIARTMGWSQDNSRSLAKGAHLHDIGKLGIPDGILLKPGPLTVEERKLMQRHVQIGFDLVADIAFLADAAEIVLTHHERYDGSGYPRGLKRDKILPSARIFAVADSFDAITSDRPYRRASSFSSGIQVIRGCSGIQFDPEVVSAFLSIPEQTWPALAKDNRQRNSQSTALIETKT